MKALGWEWWSDDMVMVCPEAKYAKLLAQLEKWSTMTEFPLDVVRKIVGKMQWMSAAFPVGKVWAAHWVHMRTKGEAQLRAMKGRGKPCMVLCKGTDEALAGLRMWVKAYRGLDRRRELFLGFGPLAGEEVLGRVDAATTEGDGCGGFLFSRDEGVLLGFSHVWTKTEREKAFVLQRESTGALEAMGAKMWFDKFRDRVNGKRVLLEMDSEPVVLALAKGYSPIPAMMACVEDVLMLSIELRVVLRVRWISGVLNAVADRLSHGRVQEAKWMAQDAFGLDLLLV